MSFTPALSRCRIREFTLNSYIEAVDLLYSEITFSFQKGRSLTTFLPTILPCRFNTIRRLSFNWTFYFWDGHLYWPPFENSPRDGSDEKFAWLDLCQRISKMPHLRYLRCGLAVREVYWNTNCRDFDAEKESQCLWALALITQPKCFTVVLTWPKPLRSII